MTVRKASEVNVYQANGYSCRRDYLRSLAEDYGRSLGDVMAVADLLGKDEDFDGLVSTLEDLPYFDD